MTTGEFRTDHFPDVVEAYRQGKQVIIVDAKDRENEGDLAIATEKITAEDVSFMLNEARGLICTSISREVSERLNLPLQVVNNNSPFNTPFAVSVDYREVSGRGVTASARALTMRKMLESDLTSEDFVSPGSVFPLIANPAGVIGRQGQTEGSYDLARIAGLAPSGVICEVMNEDGTMTRGDELTVFAEKHGLLITSVADVIAYRLGREVFVRNVATSTLDTDDGEVVAHVFQDDVSGKEHLALVYGAPSKEEPIPVRIHSECLTGDVFGSRRCDCAAQLHSSIDSIRQDGGGVVLYLRQEGRGIGLANKLRAYELQDKGYDTVEANVKLGFEADERDFAVAARMLEVIGFPRVKLLTNNPIKVKTLQECGIEVAERLSVQVPHDPFAEAYLATKKEKMGHLL
jgi:3,4-dihydroxy 2-butanone 4-phosphate synthase/GTP cyclohydrolase II